MEKELYKKRSLSTCTKTSFNLLCNNFATIFKKTWLPSLALSMASTIIVMMQAYFSQDTPSLTSFALQMLAMFIVSILLGSWMQSSYICLLNEDKQKNVFKKCCNINLWAWAYIIVTYLVVMIIFTIIKEKKTRNLISTTQMIFLKFLTGNRLLLLIYYYGILI